RDEVETFLKGLSHQVQGACQTAINDALKDARAEHTGILGRIEMLEDSVHSGESHLSAMENKASAEFQALLSSLPRLVLNAGADGDFAEAEKSMVAKRIEDAISNYLQSAGPPEDSLRSLSQRAEALQQALEGFRDALASPPPLIVPILRDIREAREEIEGLLADRTDRRLHLRFSIDFSTLRSSTRSLTEDIADGLKRQIVKLENLSEYFERRLTNSATLAASTAIDVADGQADPERRSAKLQEAITALLAAGEIQEIAPLRNEPFSAVDHMMLQRTRRANALDKPQAVARLVTRGIVHRGQILRKATVVIFE
ncbi:MAG: hypothetical protein NT154_47520, partial [Verrucomicrobia bacterium]|nr:hypothetical protein [Verrucomicrobiota bacterium]